MNLAVFYVETFNVFDTFKQPDGTSYNSADWKIKHVWRFRASTNLSNHFITCVNTISKTTTTIREVTWTCYIYWLIFYNYLLHTIQKCTYLLFIYSYSSYVFIIVDEKQISELKPFFLIKEQLNYWKDHFSRFKFVNQ